jgi:branched-chain amino acid transport system substrate-binding protein
MAETWTTKRRTLLGGAAALAGTAFLPGRLAAQDSGPIMLGALVPLTGAGGAWGPSISAGQKVVVDEVNAAGGVLGRKIELITEDSQSNPENAVRAAHKLIDADHVLTIMGTWSSAECSAVAPLAWDAKVMMILIGAADSITELPHQGYIVRTQPSTGLQAAQFAKFAIVEGARHVHVMMPQTPFTDSTFKAMIDTCRPKGIKVTTAIYDAKKTSFRSEVDAMMREAPDMLMAGGYQPDTIVLAKDVYRADFKGKVMGYAFAINEQFVAGVGNKVAEGMFAMEPVGDANSTAYARLAGKLKRDHLDIYACQGYDEVNLAVLSMAAARQASGTAVKDYVRRIGDPNGVKVDNALDGMKALAAGKAINYLGASGPCKFTPIGDVVAGTFRFTVVKDGKLVPYRTL